MENEEIKETNQENNDYINAINELKQNSVDKSEYDKLKAENKKLLDALVNNKQLDANPVANKSIAELRKAYLEPGQTNLELCTNALALRSALINAGESDPFLPIGKNIAPSTEDVSCAEHVAAVLDECISIANGNNAVFNNEIERRLVDVRPGNRAKIPGQF